MPLIITIVRNEDGTVAFQPDPCPFKPNDTVIWRNLDERSAHWIRPKDGDRNTWFEEPLARCLPGTPPPTTPELLLNTPVSVEYECSCGHLPDGRCGPAANAEPGTLKPEQETT